MDAGPKSPLRDAGECVLKHSFQSPAAAEHYERFIQMWMGADPELQRLVERAKRRLAAMKALPSES